LGETVTVRVLIADDQSMVRTGFRTFLDTQPDIEVVAEAADGAEAVERVAELAPDVVLMDVRMPLMDGLEALSSPEGPNARPAPRVLTDHDRAPGRGPRSFIASHPS
jgi:DNA-binding NarL/FixJ family response regulator